MSLSLEVKKFINSEHTGEFVNVTLPSELPVRREEVRTVHRDTAAAESAKRRARDLANARESAKRAAQSAEEALSDAHRDERAAEKELRERQSRRSALTPEYDEKNGIAARTSARCLEITDKGVTVEEKDGKNFIEADDVILCTGTLPLAEVRDSFRDTAFDVISVGDCEKVGTIRTAVESGWNAGAVL